jgi:peptidoglycan/xylan/chitin deacetylase (PgdA/CDA1 family)
MSQFVNPHPINAAAISENFWWPNNAKSALFTSFDVDAESVWLGMDPKNEERLVTLSYGGYEARVGVPKILELLKNYEVPATFFVTGWTIDAYPALCELILKAGHEIGHHGYMHYRPEPGNIALMTEEIERGLEAMKRVLGVVPVGYRAPGGEGYAEFLALMKDKGLRYSSSWRDDILPYRHVVNGQPGMVEIPVNFSYDDWLYGITHRSASRALFGRDAVLGIFKDEFDQTHEWGGVTTTVLHPQVSGRPMRFKILNDFLSYVREHDDVWFATGQEITDHFEAYEASK